MSRKLAIAAAATIAATLAVAAIASAQPSPQTTVYPKGVEVCWVSAYGPSISSNGPRISAAIGGRAACSGSAASVTPKHLQFQMWTQAHKGAPWVVAATYTVSSSRAVLTYLPAPVNMSKVYAARTWAWGNFQEPNGFAGCSLHKPPACSQSVSGAVTGPAVVVKSNG